MSDIMLPEAPVSWNVRYTSSQGYDCQLTLRGVDPAEVLKLADQLMAKMGEAGVQNGHGQSRGNGQSVAKADGAAWCAIHDCAMTRYEKDGRSWYSYRIEAGKWCKGKWPSAVDGWESDMWPLGGIRAATLLQAASIWGEADPPRTVDFSHHPHRMGHVPCGSENRLIQCTCDKLHWAGHIDGQLARSWVHSAE